MIKLVDLLKETPSHEVKNPNYFKNRKKLWIFLLLFIVSLFLDCLLFFIKYILILFVELCISFSKSPILRVLEFSYLQKRTKNFICLLHSYFIKWTHQVVMLI